MKRNVLVILGLCVLTSSGCGRGASERFGTDRFVRRKVEPAYTGPRSVSALTHANATGWSRAGPSGAAHGPNATIRAQMLEIKEANSGASVVDDVMAAFKEGTTSELVQLPYDGAQVFSAWVSSLETGETQRSQLRLKLSRDQPDRIEELGQNGRERIRRYDVFFGGPESVGWIEVKRSNSRWIIVGAGGYTSMRDPTEESDSVLDWMAE